MKAWRNIEKRYKILFYFAFIVVYFFLILVLRIEPNVPEGELRGPRFVDYYWNFTLYFSWFIIAVLGYYSRKWWMGIVIALLWWAPIIITFLSANPWIGLVATVYAITNFFTNFFTVFAASLGAISGYIGSKRKIQRERIHD